MNNWKKLAAFFLAAVMVCMVAACTPAEESTPTTEATEAPTTEATEAPTTEATEAPTQPTEDLSVYEPYLGTWYADGSSRAPRFLINANKTWSFNSADGVSLYSGNYSMSEEGLHMYDTEGSLAVILVLEAANEVYAEVYTDFLMETLTTNYFFNEITNDNEDSQPIIGDDGDVVEDPTDFVDSDIVPDDLGD